MNTVQFISHHLFVAAAGKQMTSDGNGSGGQQGPNSSTEPARPVPLEVMDRSQPLPTSLLRTMSPARTGAS